MSEAAQLRPPIKPRARAKIWTSDRCFKEHAAAWDHGEYVLRGLTPFTQGGFCTHRFASHQSAIKQGWKMRKQQ